MNVQLFIPCFVDQLYPQVAFNMVKVLEKAGFQFVNNEEEYIKSWDKVVEITCFELKKDLYLKKQLE